MGKNRSCWSHYSPLKKTKTSKTIKSAWWLTTYPSEKYDFVSWDDELSNIWKVIQFIFQTTNQKCLWSYIFFVAYPIAVAAPSTNQLQRRPFLIDQDTLAVHSRSAKPVTPKKASRKERPREAFSIYIYIETRHVHISSYISVVST